MILAQTVSFWLAAIPLGGAVSLLALVEYMRRTFAPRQGLYDADGRALFATKDDLNGMGEKVTATLNLVSSLRDHWDGVERAVDRLTVTQQAQRERVSEQLASTARTLERVTDQLEAMSNAQAEQSKAQLEHSILLKRLLKEAGE